MEILNVAGYRFVDLADPGRLRAPLHAAAQERGLKGTILLAPEGINLFLAGAPACVRDFFQWATTVQETAAAFRDLPLKESWSESVPFGRLRVRLKKEIITLKVPEIRPQDRRAPSVAATELARWLDQGHDAHGLPLVLLDTRNGFEVERGTFAQAEALPLAHFGEFKDAARPWVEQHAGAQARVVTFCTGGIRCEKAALYLERLGLPNVVQLEGGILKYLEETDGRHWRGECVVFDERIAVDAALAPAPAPTATASGLIGPNAKDPTLTAG